MKPWPLFRVLFAIMFSQFRLSATALATPGDLYVSESSTGTIYKLMPSGVRTTFASGINQLGGLAFDRSGTLFVAEGATGLILKFTPDGSRTTFASGLSLPGALAFDSSGDLFVTESTGDTGTISKLTPTGAKSMFAADGNFLSLAFDAAGNLFASTGGPTDLDGGIVWFTPDGSVHVFSFSGGPGIAFDRARNLFVTKFDMILKYTPLPARDESVFVSGFNNAIALAFDSAGNLFVTDAGNGTIAKVSNNGTKSPFASGLPTPSYLAFEPVNEKLRNISARGFVQTGDNVLIAGLIVGGNALANNAVVLRAIGPSLSHSGIANPLLDPTLELHNSSGAIIASNNNWRDTQEAQITASGLAPSDALESAIYATLPAGAYTAIVRGANDTTGVALVEAYSLTK